MAHIIKINGTESKEIQLTLDTSESMSFSLARDISAQEIYDVFQYKKGDTFEVEIGENRAIPLGAFEAFCDLIKNIIDKINAFEGNSLQEDSEQEGEDSSSLLQDEEDVLERDDNATF